MPARALTPFDRAALEVLAGVAEPVVLLALVLVPAGEVAVAVEVPELLGTVPVRVTPAAAQRAWAAEVAAVRSAPVHAPAIQVVTLLTNAWLRHRQALSVAEQPPRSALVKQLVAQFGI